MDGRPRDRNSLVAWLILVGSLLLVLVFLSGCASRPVTQFTPLTHGVGQTRVLLGDGKGMLQVDKQTQVLRFVPEAEGTVMEWPWALIERLEIIRGTDPSTSLHIPIWDRKANWLRVSTPDGSFLIRLKDPTAGVLLLAQTGIPVTLVRY